MLRARDGSQGRIGDPPLAAALLALAGRVGVDEMDLLDGGFGRWDARKGVVVESYAGAGAQTDIGGFL